MMSRLLPTTTTVGNAMRVIDPHARDPKSADQNPHFFCFVFYLLSLRSCVAIIALIIANISVDPKLRWLSACVDFLSRGTSFLVVQHGYRTQTGIGALGPLNWRSRYLIA